MYVDCHLLALALILNTTAQLDFFPLTAESLLSFPTGTDLHLSGSSTSLFMLSSIPLLTLESLSCANLFVFSSFVSFRGGNFFSLLSGVDVSVTGCFGVLIVFEKLRIFSCSIDPLGKAHASAISVSDFTVPSPICPTICWKTASL